MGLEVTIAAPHGPAPRPARPSPPTGGRASRRPRSRWASGWGPPSSAWPTPSPSALSRSRSRTVCSSRSSRARPSGFRRAVVLARGPRAGDAGAVARRSGRVRPPRDHAAPGRRAGPAPASAVSDEYFATLGVRAALGRVIGTGIDRVCPRPPWSSATDCGGRASARVPSLVGRAVQLRDRPFTVVGVLPPDFRGLQRGLVNDVWISLDTWSRFYGSPASLERREARHFEVVARLAPGATLGSGCLRPGPPGLALGDRLSRGQPRPDPPRATGHRRSPGAPDPLALLLGVGVLLVLAIAGAKPRPCSWASPTPVAPRWG